MGDIHETYNVTFRYSALYAFDAVEAGMWAGVPGELTGLSAVGTQLSVTAARVRGRYCTDSLENEFQKVKNELTAES